MKELKYVVYGDPRTKKNSQTIAGSGPRCRECGKFQKQWIRQGKANDKWAELAGRQLRPKPRRPIDFPVNIRYRFFTKIDYINSKAKIDGSNLVEAMNDILVDQGIILDDNIRIVAGTDGTRVYHDKDNPRVEICITRMPEEDTGQMKLF